MDSDNNKSLVSVIIPTYGGGEYLKRSIDSVLTQTWPAVEVVVCDDNGVGTECQLRTAEVMAEYAGDQRVKYVCHEHNINGSAARNTAFRHSRGEYIALLDDDDEFLPGNIEAHVMVLATLPADYALTYCSGKDVYHGGKEVKVMRKTFTGQDLYAILMHHVVISSSSLVIRRDCWEALGGFDETFRRHQDWEFTARVMARYKVWAMDHIGYVRYRFQRNNTSDPEKRKAHMDHYLEKMMPYIKTLPLSQQKDILISNRLQLCVTYIKRHEYGKCLNHYMNVRPGMRGLAFWWHFVASKMKRRK